VGKRWLLQHTGNLPYPGGIGSSTLAWLRAHDPGAFSGAYRIGQLSTLVGWMLTGQWAIDPSQAAFLGLWDIRKGAGGNAGWSERMCEAVGVRMESLPRVVWADEVCGHVTARAARSLGLKEGTPVVGGFVDGSAGMVETPMREGQLVHNSGSTDVLAMCVKDAVPMEGVLARPVGVGAAFPERWLAVRTIAAAGSAVEWARRVMFSEVEERAWRRIVTQACGGLHDGTARCVPTFAGERASIVQRGGAAFEGVTLASCREEMLAAIVRGLVEQSAKSYAILAKIRRPEKVVFAMGGAGALQHAMHRGWVGGNKRHVFRELEGDSLKGLVALARRAMRG
jgi:xylulokinase